MTRRSLEAEALRKAKRAKLQHEISKKPHPLLAPLESESDDDVQPTSTAPLLEDVPDIHVPICSRDPPETSLKKTQPNDQGKETLSTALDNTSQDAVTPDLLVPSSETAEDVQSEATTFEALGVCDELCLACKALGWTHPTPIQVESLPFSLQGRDIIGLAETGSGKTGAFAIPILQNLLDQPDHRGVFALVLAPTRELSVQITEQFQALGSGISLKVCTILGGMDMVAQALELAKKPHVIVATPGRIVDHLENTKGFHLGTLRYLVMDEADRLLSMDFEEALNKILQVIPKTRKTLLFSATMTDRVSKLQRASLVKPVKVQVSSSKYTTVKNLVQTMKLIAPQFKWTYLVAVLTYLKTYTSMVFVNTCLDAQKVATCLRHLGFQAVCLHGKMSQPQRLGALNTFKAGWPVHVPRHGIAVGQKRILVATEVGSRGLDIPHVDVVVNFDVPLGSKDYVHRVGRTARAGRSGRSITLVTPYDVETFQQIELAIKKRMEPYRDITDEQWRELHEKVEEARLLTERELKEQPRGPKGPHKHGKKPGLFRKKR